jgi:hypothetical protein
VANIDRGVGIGTIVDVRATNPARDAREARCHGSWTIETKPQEREEHETMRTVAQRRGGS